MGAFPDDPFDLKPDRTGLVALGGVLTPELVVEAYSKGIFPWSGEDPIPWFSPDPRLVLFPDQFHLSRSLRKLIRQRRFEVRFDTAYTTVMGECAVKDRPGQNGTWIHPSMVRVYSMLHRRGVTHSAESYLDGQLVGGLYGLSLGRTFFGESMFANVPSASKVAFFALCRRLQALDFDMIDCQQETKHLKSLGASVVTRAEFLRRLHASLGREHVPGPWPDPTEDELTI